MKVSESELCNPWAQQNRFEFTQWLHILGDSGARSLLEIGSCLGHSMAAMARAMPSGSRIVSVDLGKGAGDLEGIATADYLLGKANALRLDGYEVFTCFGKSQDYEIIREVSALGPFDACFIDGDHTTAGVAADWKNYGRFAGVTAFHDIANPMTGVPQFWMQMQGDKKRSIIEIIGSQMGIGVVFNGIPRGGFTGSEFAGWGS